MIQKNSVLSSEIFQVPENVIKNSLSGEGIISHPKDCHKMCDHRQQGKLAFLAEASKNNFEECILRFLSYLSLSNLFTRVLRNRELV